MGIYHSLISIFSSSTETNNRNVQTNSKSKKRKRRRHKQNHLLNRFFLGSKQFLINTQPPTCLFNDYYYLNSRRDLLNPIQIQISLPETSHHDTITRPVQCTIAIRRDSLKLIYCYDDFYSLDFIFDANQPVQIYIYFMAHEQYKNNNGSLSYVPCTKSSHVDTFKQFYAFNRPAGHGQVFSSIENDVRFPLSVLNENHHNCTIKSRVYPIVIVCREINSVLTNTTTLPKFDQYHIVLAAIKLLRSPVTSDRVSIVLLNQKHVYNGIVFKLFEIYSIENPPTKSNNQRKKSLIKVLSAPTIHENEPFLNQTNEINVIQKSLSNLEISLNNSNESTCVICLTDTRNVLLLPCRHLCICESCAENLKFQSANCPICRIPFRALLQMNALRYRKNYFFNNQYSDGDDEDEYFYENIALIDALNLATSITKDDYKITTNDMKYFCNEHTV